MKNIWFKEWKWIYIPIKWQGLLIVVAVIAFWLNMFFAVDKNSHSASDTLYGIFPYIASSFLLYLWAASKSSK